MLRWFDYWLKGVDNGVVKEPLVSIFVMGTNQWLHGDTYPLPATKLTKLYFSDDKEHPSHLLLPVNPTEMRPWKGRRVMGRRLRPF